MNENLKKNFLYLKIKSLKVLKIFIIFFWCAFFGIPFVILFEKLVNDDFSTMIEYCNKIFQRYEIILLKYPYHFFFIILLTLIYFYAIKKNN